MNKTLDIANKRLKSLEYKRRQRIDTNVLTIILLARDNTEFYRLETYIPPNMKQFI